LEPFAAVAVGRHFAYAGYVGHVDAKAPPERSSELGTAPKRLSGALARDPAVRWAYLFGSAARGEPFRDLDIGVVLDPELGRGAVRYGLLIAALEQAVPEFLVDVVDLSAASPALQAAAVRQGRVLLDRESAARKAWEIDVARRWLDLEPWIARGQALRLEALRARRRTDGAR
jgi:predicted nucleotidyltransferase